ncbi:hypothetical protein RUND412_011285, partial [Rhizina undulata]
MDLVNSTNRLGFKMDRFGREGASVWRGFFCNGSGLWNCASLFQNLTSIYISITTLDTFEDNEALEKDAKEGRIYQFISFAPNLRTLSLKINFRHYPFIGLGMDENPQIPLLGILGRGYVWKHLHTFNLNFTATNVKDLVEFLGRHARTLKFLRFDSVRLLNGTWQILLDFLRKRLHLTGLKINDPGEVRHDGGFMSYGARPQLRMEDYVLRGGEPFGSISFQIPPIFYR